MNEHLQPERRDIDAGRVSDDAYLLPSVTIVIPTYNRQRALRACLTSIARLDYPAEKLDVIVVDDGSEPAIDGVADGLQSAIHVTVVRQENAGPATARNRGAKLAQGEYLAFTDDDCTVSRGWLKTLMISAAAQRGDMVGGRTVNQLPHNVCSVASQLLVAFLYDEFFSSMSPLRFFTSNNLAVPRSPLLEMGGFDPTYWLAAAEDRDVCMRWLGSGGDLSYVESAIVEHHHDLTLRRFCKQQFNYGRGAMKFFRRARTRQANSDIRIQPLGFYQRLLSYPIASGAPRALTVTALFALSQALNAAGILWEYISSRR